MNWEWTRTCPMALGVTGRMDRSIIAEDIIACPRISGECTVKLVWILSGFLRLQRSERK